ncbi:hypothetical protein D3C84_715900 [compost metagenome]
MPERPAEHHVKTRSDKPDQYCYQYNCKNIVNLGCQLNTANVDRRIERNESNQPNPLGDSRNTF